MGDIKIQREALLPGSKISTVRFVVGDNGIPLKKAKDIPDRLEIVKQKPLTDFAGNKVGIPDLPPMPKFKDIQIQRSK